MERKICEQVIELLSNYYDKDKFGIEQRSDKYLTLVYCDNDFFRVKYTNKARWISIRLAKEDRNVDDPRFEAEQKKTQMHWKANITAPEDINKFEDVLINACKSLGGTEYKPRENTKSTITFSFKDLINKLKG